MPCRASVEDIRQACLPVKSEAKKLCPSLIQRYIRVSSQHSQTLEGHTRIHEPQSTTTRSPRWSGRGRRRDPCRQPARRSHECGDGANMGEQTGRRQNPVWQLSSHRRFLLAVVWFDTLGKALIIMGKHGESAVIAARNCKRTSSSPRSAWTLAVAQIFPDSESCRKKSCPRGAFLGLCEAGFVVGVPPGDYIGPNLNADYAIVALKLLRRDPSLATTASSLWRRVASSSLMKHNQQMDVVLSLWHENLLH